MNSGIRKLLWFVLAIAAIYCVYRFFIAKYVSLEMFQMHSGMFKEFVSRHYVGGVAAYVLALIVVLLFGLPLVPLFALVAGYLFGTVYGVIYSEIGAVLGAITSFLIYRSFFYNLIKTKYKTKFAKFEHELKKGGASYLLTLQFLGIVPFFVINAVAILADLPLRTMIWTTALGTLPFLIVYVAAGSRLGSIKSMHDLLSWQTIGMLLILAVLSLIPVAIKRIKKYYHI